MFNNCAYKELHANERLVKNPISPVSCPSLALVYGYTIMSNYIDSFEFIRYRRVVRQIKYLTLESVCSIEFMIHVFEDIVSEHPIRSDIPLIA